MAPMAQPTSRQNPVSLPPWPAALAMALAQMFLYLRGLHPGVADGDSAELQWAAPLLGIAHAPGYALQITAGKFFTMLPLGGDAAWRMNLLSAVCGVLGALALFSAVRRITGRVLPALLSQAMLAFGSVYWSQSLVAEVYVFGGMFLCFAIDAAARYAAGGRAVWLAAAAFALGVVCAERPSELLVVPAFAAMLLAFRGRVPITARRWALAAVCLAAPFVIALALNLVRADPGRLAVRDDALRDGIVGYHEGEVTFDYGRTSKPIEALATTTSFMLGLKWSGRFLGDPRGGEFVLPGIGHRAARMAWLLAGGGLFGSRFAPPGSDPMLEGGVSPGLAGLALALAGAILWRRTPGWVVLGTGIFAANLCFILAYHAWDSLTFAIPGQIGLALLAGLGSAGPPAAVWSSRATLALGLVSCIVVMSLIPINAAVVNRNTPEERAHQQRMARVAQARLPDGAAILTKYWPAMTMRYLFWVQSGRTDISVIHAMRGTHLKLAAALHNQGRAVFFTNDIVPERIEKELVARTPEEFRSLGLLRLGDLPDFPLPQSP